MNSTKFAARKALAQHREGFSNYGHKQAGKSLARDITRKGR